MDRSQIAHPQSANVVSAPTDGISSFRASVRGAGRRAPWRGPLFFVACALLPLAVSGQSIIDLLDLGPEERVKAVQKFIETKAAEAPLSDVVALFDPDLALGPEELEAAYFAIAPRMERKEFPVLSGQAKSMEPGAAAPALRLLGRSANQDAFEILTERLKDKVPEVAIAAAEGLGFLGNRKAIPSLEPLTTDLTTSPDPGNRPWNTDSRTAVSAALALAHLGQWHAFPNALNELGQANTSRLNATYGACRTTYNSPEQCRMSLKHVLTLKQWFRHVVPWLEQLCRNDPTRFAAAIGHCRHPYAIDMAYAVIHKILDKGNAAAMLPLLKSISNEIKALYLDLGEPFFDAPTKQKVQDSIRAHAKRANDARARLFAFAYAHWLPEPERAALLKDLLQDQNPWVRHEATARKPAGLQSGPSSDTPE